jgi:hypothetical protein
VIVVDTTVWIDFSTAEMRLMCIVASSTRNRREGYVTETGRPHKEFA